MTETALSEQFAKYANGLEYEDLTEKQIRKLKLHILDWLGTVYAGKDEKPIRILLDMVDSLGGEPQATVIPTGKRVPCFFAAMLNSASSCLLEMDDLHRGAIFHPASVVVPSAICVAQKEHTTGKALLAAIAAGYEIGIRVASAVGLSHYEYWHTTATCGTFAAAAAAAKVLGLDTQQTVHALGSAGTQAAGLWAFLVESAMSKPLHIGKAPMNGVMAAMLAQKGFTGAYRIFEGKKGFFAGTSHDYDVQTALSGLGEVSLFEQTSLKLYASCGHTHPAIDAVFAAVAGRLLKADEVERIDVYIYQAALDLLEKVEAVTPTQAKFNLPFCVATALEYGHADLNDFNMERLENPGLRGLMKKTALHNADDLTGMYPAKWAARVEVRLIDGGVLEGKCDFPRGDPQNPPTEQEVLDKFYMLTDHALSPETAEMFVERIMRLETSRDINGLFDI